MWISYSLWLRFKVVLFRYQCAPYWICHHFELFASFLRDAMSTLISLEVVKM